MTKIMYGVVHGKTIEFRQEIGVPEGQLVEVAIQLSAGPEQEPWGEGLRRSAGALVDMPGLDEDMDQILRDRKSANFREVPE